MINNLENYADVLAIPLFILLSYYFITKKNKTKMEYVLMVFAIGGAVADIYFTYNFFGRKFVLSKA